MIMMDPISASSGLITLVTTALSLSKAVYSLIDSILNAPEELRVLSNDLQDLRVVLASVEMSMTAIDNGTLNVSTSVLPTILRRIGDKLNQLHHLLTDFGEIKQGKLFNFRSWEWSLRGRERAKRIRDELHSMKWNVSTSLSTLSNSSTQRIGMTVNRVEVEMGSLRQDFTQASTIFQQTQEHTSLAIQGLRQTQDKMNRLLNNAVDQMKIEASIHGANSFLLGQQHSLLPPTAVAVHLSLQQRTMCVASCPCLCHQWRQVSSPKILDRLIGSVAIGFSGVPLATRKCTTAKCRFQATYALKLFYRFPSWMLAQAITVAAYSKYGQPTAGLSVTRIRPHSSQIFMLAESGNTKGLKYAFDHGLASPFDVSAQTGDQPLHIAASHGFVDACRLLISYGADPHEYDIGHKNTPHSFAWNLILAKNIPMSQQQSMAVLFPNVYASNKFPRLHELMLELKHGDLQAEVNKPNVDINAQDTEGNTALAWACLRGDPKTALWLLERGADPNIPNRSIGRTALMSACTSVSLPCIKLLLDYNVNVNILTHGGLDALIYLVEEDRNPQPISDIVQAGRLLIERGISLAPHGPNRVWCLARAARTEMTEMMNLIMDQGVDINYVNDFGLTALARSIAWSAHRAAQLLLARGALYTGSVEKDTDGRTILHHAALNPSKDIVRVLTEARITGLNTDLKDKDGLTAADYVERADNDREDWASAFQQLLADIHGWNIPRENSCDSVEANDLGTELNAVRAMRVDDFVDACEWQEPTYAV